MPMHDGTEPMPTWSRNEERPLHEMHEQRLRLRVPMQGMLAEPCAHTRQHETWMEEPLIRHASWGGEESWPDTRVDETERQILEKTQSQAAVD